MNRMIDIYKHLENFTGIQDGDDKLNGRDIEVENSVLMPHWKWINLNLK